MFAVSIITGDQAQIFLNNILGLITDNIVPTILVFCTLISLGVIFHLFATATKGHL